MIRKTSEANLAMVVSKTFSGLNVNALRYLLPLWTEQDDSRLCGDFHLHATDLGFPLIGTLSPRENNNYEDHRNFSWVKRSAIMYFDTKKR